MFSAAIGSPLPVFTWVWIALWIGGASQRQFASSSGAAIVFQTVPRARFCLRAPASFLDGRLRCLSKAIEVSDTAVELRPADGFLGSLPRYNISCSVALGRSLPRRILAALTVSATFLYSGCHGEMP